MEHRRLQERDDKIVSSPGSDPGQAAYCLRPHADYGCHHSGACCTAGWAIPVDGPVFDHLRIHFGRSGEFRTAPPLPEGAAAILNLRDDGACIFFEAERGRLCAVHRELGEDLLPTACRQFPRIPLHDARGLLISLSHYCPTAAALLLDDHPLEIVLAPPSLTLGGRAEGLDARGVLPPLLRPGMLTDLDGYASWERRALDTLARGDLSAGRALATIDAATRAILRWSPGMGPLASAVHREFDVALAPEPDEDLDADCARMLTCLASVPYGLPVPSVTGLRERWPAVARWWPDVDRPVRAYLAARLFGNWVAYYGRGLHSVVEYLRVCLSVLKLEAARQQQPESRCTAVPASTATSTSLWQTVLEAIRNADLLLVHLSDTKNLARRLS
jgi:hypothetical protein